ncbi:Ring Finger Protein 44 [Manis pentadactyla]|nr:Ring Finger Protein 44 [Manis pentadactyla]
MFKAAKWVRFGPFCPILGSNQGLTLGSEADADALDEGFQNYLLIMNLAIHFFAQKPKTTADGRIKQLYVT